MLDQFIDFDPRPPELRNTTQHERNTYVPTGLSISIRMVDKIGMGMSGSILELLPKRFKNLCSL